MALTWPWALFALLAVPLLLGTQWWLRSRRRKVAVRVSNIEVVRVATPPAARWRRRIPAALFVTSLATLGVGSARPTASVAVARSSTSILLAIDVSRSMCSTDVAPNRLEVAKRAAHDFVEAQPQGTRIGVVAFAGIAGLIVPPTTDERRLLAAIEGLATSRGTAIGMAILASIDAIAEHNAQVAPTGVDLPASDGVPAGGFQPDTIVVLTDGANTQGVDPLVAAEQAAARRVRVYTIGFGTTEPSQPVCDIDQIGDGFPSGGPPIDVGPNSRGRRFLQIDEDTLTKIATMTGGQYFRAQDAQQLDDVFHDLPRQVEVQHERHELTVWFVLAAGLLALAAVGLSLAWNRYP